MSLARLLRGDDFERLLSRARSRLEREPDALRVARTSLRDPTPGERRAVGGLLGRRFSGATVTVSLLELDQALVEGTGRGLLDWLTELGGPLRDRPAEERARREAIAAALERVSESALASERWFVDWIEELQGGTLTRLVGEQALARLHRAVLLLECLPADDVPIALFASDHAGGTKELDGTPLERLVLRGLALRAGVDRPSNAEERRELWGRFGVVPDDLAAHVLVLNLPATGGGVVDEFLRVGARAGVPLRLTLHQLVHHAPTLRNDDVFVCENPAILRMAAERLGPRCAPLIATEGRASTAFWRLMAMVSGRVFARGDFDKEGLEIAGAVLERTSGHPWRFDLTTYLDTRRVNERVPERLPDTPWDPGLARAMAGQCRVEEEELLETLLGDLNKHCLDHEALDTPAGNSQCASDQRASS